MSALHDAEAAVAAVVPQAGAWRALAGILAALAGIALLGFAAWWLFARPHALATQAAQAKVDAHVAQGAAAAASDALRIQVVHDREVIRIDAATREGENAIRDAAGGEATSPAVAAALRAALCGMRAYQSDRDCAAVPRPGGSVGAAGGDAGGEPPAR